MEMEAAMLFDPPEDLKMFWNLPNVDIMVAATQFYWIFNRIYRNLKLNFFLKWRTFVFIIRYQGVPLSQSTSIFSTMHRKLAENCSPIARNTIYDTIGGNRTAEYTKSHLLSLIIIFRTYSNLLRDKLRKFLWTWKEITQKSIRISKPIFNENKSTDKIYLSSIASSQSHHMNMDDQIDFIWKILNIETDEQKNDIKNMVANIMSSSHQKQSSGIASNSEKSTPILSPKILRNIYRDSRNFPSRSKNNHNRRVSYQGQQLPLSLKGSAQSQVEHNNTSQTSHKLIDERKDSPNIPFKAMVLGHKKGRPSILLPRSRRRGQSIQLSRRLTELQSPFSSSCSSLPITSTSLCSSLDELPTGSTSVITSSIPSTTTSTTLTSSSTSASDDSQTAQHSAPTIPPIPTATEIADKSTTRSNIPLPSSRPTSLTSRPATSNTPSSSPLVSPRNESKDISITPKTMNTSTPSSSSSSSSTTSMRRSSLKNPSQVTSTSNHQHPPHNNNNNSSQSKTINNILIVKPSLSRSESSNEQHHSSNSSSPSPTTSSSYDHIYTLLQSSQPSLQDVAKSNVKVAVRMRPLNNRERCMYAQPVIRMKNKEVHVMEHSAEKSHCFVFDYCFDANDSRSPEQVSANPAVTGTGTDTGAAAGSQQGVFEALGVEVLRYAWMGYNTSIFAYGQTGSGKSYSMMGSPQDTGIIPRVCEALFYMIDRENQKLGTGTGTGALTTSLSSGMEAGKGDGGERTSGSSHCYSHSHYNVEASYLEIYNETIRDLLNSNKVNLKVREHPTLGVFVENLSSCAVQSFSDINDLLTLGLQQRTVAATNMNEASSRSHSIFTITISRSMATSAEMEGESRDRDESHAMTDTSSRRGVRVNKLCLIDLAGSERAQATGSTGIRLKEGASINKSLSTLGRCISALAKLSSHEGRLNSSNNNSRRNSRALLTSSPSDSPGLSESGLPPAAPPSHARRPAILVPYRDSVLTSILRESLCGNAKTAMLATISPADNSLSETLSTLRYAQSAKQIQTKAVLLEDDSASASATILSLKAEILALQNIISASQQQPSLRSPSPTATSTLRDLESAEVALHSQTALWETKVASMEKIKSKLHSHQIVATLAGEEGADTDPATGGGRRKETTADPPYIVSLSNDPQLHQAVKIYLSRGSILRVGRLPRPGESPQLPEEKQADLQLDGLGVEIEHCILDHDRTSDEVWLHVAPGAITYVNGRQSDPRETGDSEGSDGEADNGGSARRAKGANIVDCDNDSIARDSGERSTAVTATNANRSEAVAHNDFDGDGDGEESVSLDPSVILTSPFIAAEAKKKFVSIDGNPSSIRLQSGDRLVFGACSHVFVYIHEQSGVRSSSSSTDSSTVTGAREDEKATTATVVIPSYQQAMREVILGRLETDLERKRRLAAMVLNLSRGPHYRQLFEEKLVEALKTIREANTILLRLCPFSDLQFTTFLSTRLPEDVVPTISLRGLFEFNKISIRIGCYRNSSTSTIDSGSSSYPNPSHQKKTIGHTPSVFRAYSVCKNAHHLSSSPSYYSMHKSHSSSSTPPPMAMEHRRTESFDDAEDFNLNLNRIFEVSLSDFYEGMLVLKSHFTSLFPLCVFIEQVCNSFDSLSQSKYFGNLPAIIEDLHLLLVPPATSNSNTAPPGDDLSDRNIGSSNPINYTENPTAAAAPNTAQTQLQLDFPGNNELKTYSSESNLEIITLSITTMSQLLESLNLNGQEFATLFYEYREIDEMIDMQSDCRAFFKALETLFLKTILNCFINFSDVEESEVLSQHPRQHHLGEERERASAIDNDLPYDTLFSNNSIETEFYRVNSFCDKSIRNPIRNLERGIVGRNYNSSNNSSQHVNWSDDELEEEVEQVEGGYDISGDIQNMTNYDIMRAFEEVEDDEDRQQS